MKRKFLALELVVILLLNVVLPVVNFAATEEADLTISTKEELLEFAEKVNSGTDNFYEKTVTLEADIDLGGEEWTPIGTVFEIEKMFCGVFDGKNHTIKGLKINSNETYVGLFGIVSGTIRNLKISDGSIVATKEQDKNQSVGAIAGEVTGYYYGVTNYIQNCHNLGVTISATNSIFIGGVVACLSSERVYMENCSNKAKVSVAVDTTGGFGKAGGIVGSVWSANLTKCYNEGEVLVEGNTAVTTHGVGGVMGSLSYSSASFCYNVGKVSSEMSTGGVIGTITNDATLTNSYNIGQVSSTNPSGTNSCVGSAIGTVGSESSSANVSNVFYLEGTASQGVGYIYSGTVTTTQKTSTEMKTQDFVDLLNNGQSEFSLDKNNQNSGYPVLLSSVEIQFSDDNLYEAIVEILSSEIIEMDDTQKTITLKQEDLESVTKLELGEKEITDISGLEQFTNLQELQIYSNNIEDISVLENNTSLKIININNNQLTDEDMQIFATMQNLEILGVANNKSITKIGDLDKLTNLLELNAINNSITDLTGIEKMTGLQELYLSGNKIEDISLVPDIDVVEIKNQSLEKEIRGDKRDELLITMPNIFEQALDENSKYYSEDGLELVNVTIEDGKLKLKPYTVAKNGAIIKVKSGVLQDSYLYFNSVSIEYQSDLTTEENLELFEIDLDLDSNGEINATDAELIAKWYKNEELTEEQQQKVSKMDLNNDGNINARDYKRFLNYINKSSDVLVTVPIEIGQKVNTNVVVGIITNKQFADSNTEGDLESYNYVFEENGEYQYFSDDDAILAVVDFIDKVAPEYEIRYSTTEPTSGDVTVTIVANEELLDIYQINDEETDGEENTWTLSDNKKVLTKVFTENVEEEVQIIDLGHNSTTVSVKIENIKKDLPLSAEIKFYYENGDAYTLGEWANEDVRVSIDEDSLYEGITAKFSIDGQGEYTTEQVISEDGDHSVVITTTDEVGNVNVGEYLISIDKTSPEVGKLIVREESSTGTVLDNNTTTSKNLYITVQDGTDAVSGHLKTVYIINDGEEHTESQILRNEGEYNIKVITYDEAGNSSESTYTYIISKNAPTVTVSYVTNSDKTVTAKITSNKQLQEVEGWTLSDDKLSMEKTYSINQQETVEISDLSGNTITVVVNIEGIDNTEFLAEVSYSTTKPTNEGVEVTIISNKQMSQLSGFSISQDKKSQTKTFLNNTQEQVTVADLSGNKITLNIEITNIDRQAPSAEVTYSTKQLTDQDVTVTIKADEKVQSIDGWKQTSDQQTLVKTYSQNETETIDLTDLAGNVTQIPIEITNINKADLQLEIKYSTTSLTNQNVIVTINANIPVKQASGWTLSEDKMQLTKEYSKNTTENVQIQSELGHKQTVTITINNVDKLAPSATVTYSETDKTTEPVTVTIRTNEKVQSVSGWTLNSEQNILTKTYTENTEENIVIKDLAGNQTTVTIKVNQIDEEIQSQYEITEDGYILGIKPNTTKEEFIEKLGYNVELGDIDVVSTGMQISIGNRTYTLVVAGDINKDGTMNLQDLSMLLLHLAGYEDRILTGAPLMAADVNFDDETDIIDLSKMSMVLSGAMEI